MTTETEISFYDWLVATIAKIEEMEEQDTADEG